MAKRYRATRPLEFWTAPSVLAKLRAGENLPMHLRGKATRLAAGAWADEWARLMPKSSVDLYVRKGWVEAVEVESDQGGGE